MTEGSEATTVLHAVETSGQWIGPPERPLMSWLTTPVEGPASVGVLVVPPVGYEYWNSHRSCGPWPSALPRVGVVCCASTSTAWGLGRGPVGCQSARSLARQRRPRGRIRAPSAGRHVTGRRRPADRRLVGVDEGADVGADAVVAWAPVIRGRRYVSELQLLGLPVPEVPDFPERSGGVVQAGSVFSAETLAALVRSTWPRCPPVRRQGSWSSTGTTSRPAPSSSNVSALWGSSRTTSCAAGRNP